MRRIAGGKLSPFASLKCDLILPAQEAEQLKQILAITLSILLPIAMVAADSGYKVSYDGGSVPDIKTGTDLRLHIESNQLRLTRHTAAEDLLEIIMRRYERFSTLLTSNRPVEDWGKLLGDVAAVSPCSIGYCITLTC